MARTFRYDQRTFWRIPQAAFFTVLLPVMMLVIFTLNDRSIDALHVAYARYLLVGMTIFTVAGASYGNLAARITWRRETGIYQRLRTTPMPAWAMVAGQVVSAVTVVLLTLSLLLVIAATFFDVALPTSWPLFLAVVALGTACCAALGAAMSTFVTSVEAVDPVVWATMLPLMFVSGVFQYVSDDSWVARVADLFPIRHLLLANMDAFGIPGSGDVGWHLAVVAAWTALGLLVAVRRFRWAPHR
ncbi:MAG TPA: ABC transporter permease [Acidimicrobiia bacterium]